MHHTDLIGVIAAFIGARLQYPNPRINGQGNPWVSTISVDQHKNKFDDVRVYCNLAQPALVRQKWLWLKENQHLKSEIRSFYFPNIDVSADEPTDEFLDRCIKHDAMYYREVYEDMVALQPHLRGKICRAADHTELLYGTLQEVIDKLDETGRTKEGWLESYCKKYRVADLNSLKEFMRMVYEPTMKERMSSSG